MPLPSPAAAHAWSRLPRTMPGCTLGVSKAEGSMASLHNQHQHSATVKKFVPVVNWKFPYLPGHFPLSQGLKKVTMMERKEREEYPRLLGKSLSQKETQLNHQGIKVSKDTVPSSALRGSMCRARA